MLYSLLFSTLTLAILCPLLAVFCFVKGYNLAAAKHGEKPLKVLTGPKKEPAGDSRLEQLWANIDAYDGTEKGQKEIV